ncbi:hypothetical protein SSX86_012463 [Deinandra increscens subsp. villosa]|uniref:peptidylprolyl isomerase n=1 Tax=Deinandra increscens subsp. villosa TaxID=3103831 RepID=A0AAP0H1J9_9ASTR
MDTYYLAAQSTAQIFTQTIIAISFPIIPNFSSFPLLRNPNIDNLNSVQPKEETDSKSEALYPDVSEEEFVKACPFCCNNCNCKACLRRLSLEDMQGYSCSEPDKVKYSKQILRKVYPLVKRLNADQLKEKEIEAKVKGVSISELQVEDANCEVDDDIFCDKCGSYFFDLYRSCACGYDLCLECCQELRDGQLKGMTYGWKAHIDGSIPCPPKDIGGCNDGTLELKRIMGVDWIVNLLEKAQGIYKNNYIYDNPQTSTEFSANYLYSLSAKDIQPQHMQCFQFHWSRGEPIIVNDVLSTSSGLSWEPMVLWRAFRDITKTINHSQVYKVHAINFLDWSEVDVDLGKFCSGYSPGQLKHEKLLLILKLEDWQPSCLSQGEWPRHFVEFVNFLPFKDYTNPYKGYLNVAVKLPDLSLKPDMGPKMDIAYGIEEELEYGNSVTKLHYEKSDTIGKIIIYALDHAVADLSRLVDPNGPTNDIQDQFANAPEIVNAGNGMNIDNHTNGWVCDSESENSSHDTDDYLSVTIEDSATSEEPVGLWHGNAVGLAAKEMLQAVEHRYPDTFQGVQIRSKPYWLSILKELHVFVKGFVETPVDALAEDEITRLEDDLNDFERFGFDLSWARKRLDMVKNLKFGNDPLRLELLGVEESLKLSHKELVEANARLEKAQLDYDRATDARNKKVHEMEQKFGAEYDDVLNGNLGLERVLEECWIDWFSITRKMSNKSPLVYFDVSIDGDPVERMVFELFSDIVPKTAENFRALCTGEKGSSQKTGKPLHYKGSFFHRIVKGSFAQGGDFLKRDGSYGESIYGGKFPDESSKLKHDAPGLLTMAIADRDSRGSLFNLTFAANRHLDRKYIIFGKLVQGVDVLKKIENVGDGDGRPTVTVKIIYCGELSEGENQSSDKKMVSKKTGKDVSSEVHSHEVRRKRKHKKSSKDRRKKRKRYSSSESDSSSDMDSDSSDSDSEFDSDISSSSSSSSSDLSSSSDERRKRKKRPSKRDRRKRDKRRDKRRAKKRRKRDKKSKRKSKRSSDSVNESASEHEHGSEDNGDARKPNRKHNNLAKLTDGNQSPSAEVEDGSGRHKTGDAYEREDGEHPKENGNRPSNGAEIVNVIGRSDLVNDQPHNSRSISKSPQRDLSKSMSVSPRRSPNVSPRRNLSRSPSVSGSPRRATSLKSRSPVRGESSSKSPVRSISRSPVRGKRVKSTSPSPVRSQLRRTISRSPTPSPPRSRRSSRKSVSRSPVRSSRVSYSRSPVRSSKRSLSRSPVRSSKRSLSRSSGRPPLRRSRSPVRPPVRSSRRSFSRSPVGGRRGRSPSRSVSPDGSPKRIRRGRGFSNRYSYARRYHSPDRSPVRSYRYGRSDHDRYSSYRRRSPLRDRSPPRYRARRSRTRSPSVSRSPVRYRRRISRSRSPVEISRYRPSPPVERRRAPRSRTPPSRSRSPYEPRSSPSLSPRINRSRSKSKSISRSRSRSRSSSGSPAAKKGGLVSYGDGSPDSGQK